MHSTQDRSFLQQDGGDSHLPCSAADDGMEGDVSTPEASLMEFIIVRVKGRPTLQVSVLINGQRNGTTGALITLGGPGWVAISVDLPGEKFQVVDVTNTTPTHPMEIEVVCD
ncbi:MAG: hypothetical protein DMF06_01570 [Verrucomicrobia bacterium]|nr:MAG: hypothetical protein DMF06_01570 [Verrucomicrobiota bacterium]